LKNQEDSAPRLPASLRALFDAVRDGRLDPADAERQALELAQDPFEDLGFARVDHHRAIRQGFPEVVFGQGKQPDQIARIARAIVDRGHSLLVTRTDATAFAAVSAMVPDVAFHEQARIIERRLPVERGKGIVLIAAAGTSDIPVAEEAAVSAEVMGNDVDRLYDVGVAGLHRLLSERDRVLNARVIIAVAGMEGALASVVGGLVKNPVIAVPTSVGYGASFGGITALLAMLNSCATGVSVVNIDNGFGAAAIASSINHL
jgi:pyridinium-3,5-biscarboxylic acid mononucleotide synthase